MNEVSVEIETISINTVVEFSDTYLQIECSNDKDCVVKYISDKWILRVMPITK